VCTYSNGTNYYIKHSCTLFFSEFVCSIFSFQCNQAIVCFFGHCIFHPSLSYIFWLPFWYMYILYVYICTCKYLDLIHTVILIILCIFWLPFWYMYILYVHICTCKYLDLIHTVILIILCKCLQFKMEISKLQKKIIGCPFKWKTRAFCRKNVGHFTCKVYTKMCTGNHTVQTIVILFGNNKNNMGSF
jgi:hypothetical protein